MYKLEGPEACLRLQAACGLEATALVPRSKAGGDARAPRQRRQSVSRRTAVHNEATPALSWHLAPPALCRERDGVRLEGTAEGAFRRAEKKTATTQLLSRGHGERPQCHQGGRLFVFASITGELNRRVAKRLEDLTEPQTPRPSYLAKVIEIDNKGNPLSLFTRLMKDLAFRADDYGSSHAKRAGTVYIHEIALVHDGVCLSDDEFQ